MRVAGAQMLGQIKTEDDDAARIQSLGLTILKAKHCD